MKPDEATAPGEATMKAPATKPALILQHGDLGPPALLGEWARARGIAVEIHRSDQHRPLPEINGQPFVASLGSNHSPNDTHVPEVSREVQFIDRVVAAGVPVLGLCFGGQVLAKVLGAKVEPSPEPELGWHRIRVRAPELLVEGPWLQWHYYRFSLPPGARELAYSPAAVQAFSHGPHLGIQFHPESTLELALEWARVDRARRDDDAIPDRGDLVAVGREHAAAAREAAFRLFDAFRERAAA